MPQKISKIAIDIFATLLVLGTANQAVAQAATTPSATTPYAKMAPVDQYLMADRAEEIALARSAAPGSISHDAEVQVLGRHGFETAVKGTNGFVCIVGRSWTSAAEADFWNPKVRVPMCVNAAAARSYLLHFTRVSTAIARKELPPMEPGSMCYMMSKEGYGGDSSPHWPSHLMFFFTDTDLASWGANLPGSPVIGLNDPVEHLTQFVLTVPQWSDGTQAGDRGGHHH